MAVSSNNFFSAKVNASPLILENILKPCKWPSQNYLNLFSSLLFTAEEDNRIHA